MDGFDRERYCMIGVRIGVKTYNIPGDNWTGNCFGFFQKLLIIRITTDYRCRAFDLPKVIQKVIGIIKRFHAKD